MSVPAYNPASAPAQPGSSATAGQGIGAQAAQGHGPLGGFEALMAALFGAQGAEGAANAGALLLGKGAGKPGTAGTAAANDGKAKTADDAKAVATDGSAATATPDATLALLLPTSATIVIVPPTPTKSGEAAAAPALAATADKSPGQTALAKLAQLAGQPLPDGIDAAKTQAATAQATTGQAATAQAALAASTAAGDAATTAKVQAPAPQTPAPQAPVSQAPDAALVVQSAAQLQVQPQGLPAPAIAQGPVVPLPAGAAPKPNTEVKAEPVAATGAKGGAQAAKSARVDGAPAEAAPNAEIAAKAANALQPISEGPTKGDINDRGSQAPAVQAGPEDAPQPAAGLDTSSTTTPATLIHAAAVAVRGAPQTVANLAAQIAKKLDGRSTRFDVQLEPAGLGKVDVRVEIGAGGRMSAAMAFDTPQAAAELRSRAGELQRALEQAGFDISGGLSFDVAGDSGQGGQAQGQNPDANPNAAFRGQAFQAVLDTAADAAPSSQLAFRQSSAAGVDIRI
ncbi:MAG: flagellar hook length determination-like protein [Phenylobacterium sp.]|uniref:flagellar hook-length control protein FliK n=1 Tax=Phenylobacterium sp. TaxID=1871053 RepID=UPI002618434B|nr:flagellar hook-length control protein FliK [Phenylobacterium sp.]MDB5497337.1 flagellar hook length determination-like protein [Phenylobacterium sp.]